jgi:hypothetical protein
LLRKGGIYRFHTSAEKEVVRQIKESKSTVYVAYNYDKEEELEEKGEIESVDYKLPDGNVLKVISNKITVIQNRLDQKDIEPQNCFSSHI